MEGISVLAVAIGVFIFLQLSYESCKKIKTISISIFIRDQLISNKNILFLMIIQ